MGMGGYNLSRAVSLLLGQTSVCSSEPKEHLGHLMFKVCT